MPSARGLVFDIDGCLMRGPRPIAGAPETCEVLRDRGLLIRYFTNDSSKTPVQIAARLEHAGFQASPAEVITSALVAAEYAAERFSGKRVLALGGTALTEALLRQGLQLVGGPPADVVIVGRDLALDRRHREGGGLGDRAVASRHGQAISVGGPRGNAFAWPGPTRRRGRR